MRFYCDGVRETRNVFFFNFYIITTVKSMLQSRGVHVSVCMRVTILRKPNNIYFPAESWRAFTFTLEIIFQYCIFCARSCLARGMNAL